MEVRDKLKFVEGVFLTVTPALVSITANAPLDRLKLLLQTQNENMKQMRLGRSYKGAIDCLLRTYKTEGLLSLWRSNAIGCMAYFPSQALNVGFYGLFKDSFKVTKEDGYITKFSKSIASGAAAGAISLLLVYPIDFTKTKFATDIKINPRSPYRYRTIIDVGKRTIKSSGITGMYRGLVVSLAGVVVYRGCYFGFYDTFKPIVLGSDSSLMSSFLLGYGVTVLSGLVAYPLDTLRCRMIMRVGQPAQYKGSIDCAIKVVKAEGFMALMKGAGVNVLRGITGACILAGMDSLEQYYLKLKNEKSLD